MNEAMQRSYRSITMRAAFLAQDRPDIAEATKSLARHMKAPNEAAWADLKRLGRYLRGKPRLVYEYHPPTIPEGISPCTATRTTPGASLRGGLHQGS